MDIVDDSLDKLKKAVQKSKSKCKKDHASTLSQIKSYLVFLKSSSISSDAASKLRDVLRQRLPTLYSTYPELALGLTSVLCRSLYDDKILKDFTAGNPGKESRWEHVLNASLSGVLDILDAEPEDKFKEAIGSSLYPTLCSILSSASIAHMSAELRCTGYSVLADSAEAHTANQKRLLQADLLGGTKLGSMLWRTKDYLVLESILNLFARMIPSSGSSETGRAIRRAFIRSVFVDSSPDDLGTGEQLADTVERVTTSDWEQTAAKIVDILAGSNIGFPQPFKVPEVFVGEEPNPSDRVYVDGQGFLANVLVGEDLFDSLTAPYSTVTKIEITNRTLLRHSTSPQFSARVVVTLTSRPTIGQKLADTQTIPTLTFAIDESDVQRLRAALDSRRMGHMLVVHSAAKQSILVSPAALEIDLAGNPIGRHELEQRIENLSQFYETNEPNEDLNLDLALQDDQIQCIDPSLLSLVPSQHAASIVPLAEKHSDPLPARALISASTPKRTAAPDAVFAAADDVPNPLVSAPITPNRRTTSQILCEKAFGTSDDDLSEPERPPSPPKVLRKSVTNVLPMDSNKPARTTLRTKGRVVLDSDDDLPASTPSRPPPKKKVILVSDDEIEEVVSANKPTVTRRRSVLAMTAVTPSGPSSLSRRQSAQFGALSSRKKSAVAVVPGNSSDEPIVLDSPIKSVPETRADTRKVTLRKASLAEAETKLGDMRQGEFELGSSVLHAEPHPVRVSSPPVQPVKKAVRGALRKKGEPLNTSPAEPLASKGTKRKQIPDHLEDAAPVKRAKPESKPTVLVHTSLEKAESPVFEPDLVSSGRAKKHYGGRKKRTCSPPPAPAEPMIDYDVIPGPVTSASKAVKPKPKPKAVKAKPALKEPAKAAEKTPSVELKAVKKTTRAVATKGKENDTATTSQKESKSTARKAKLKSAAAERHEPVEDSMFGDQCAVEEHAEPFESEEVSMPEELDTAKKSPRVATNIDTIKLVKDTVPCKKSDKAPWNSLDITKLDQPDHSSSAAKNEATNDHTPIVLPEISDNLDDPTVVAYGDFVDTVDANSASEETTEIESHQCQATTLHKPDIEDVPCHPVHATPEKPQPISKVANGSPTRNDVMREESHAAPIGIVELPVFEPVEQRYQDMTDIKAPILKLAKPKAAAASIFSPFYKPLQSTPKNPSKKTRFEYSERRGEKRLDAPPDMEDLANVLQQIQEAVLHKITHRVEGVRHKVRRGREIMLEEAAADLTAMRDESVDRYNYLIELEADYATFGRELTHALDDLTVSNRVIKGDLEKIIQAHDRGSIVKHAPTSLFPAQLPTSIRRFCS